MTEYLAQILENEKGDRFVASFPEGVSKAVQYRTGVKAHSVYMSQFQLIPYNRIQDYFADQLHMPVSEESIFNFNQEAFELLADFENGGKNELAASDMAHADETGINIGGKRLWLHCVSNNDRTFYGPHKKRGSIAMNDMGILPQFKGTLCHDHWKPYYKFDCTHALCNAHHLRELTRAFEQDGQQWANKLKNLLETINRKVTDAGVVHWMPGTHQTEKGTTGSGETKSGNLLERMKNYEQDTLRFMDNDDVPFTNNPGESDIRMTKVQQKVSGCFRSINGARILCRIRGYLSTCREQGGTSSHALSLLFNGKLPEFLM